MIFDLVSATNPFHYNQHVSGKRRRAAVECIASSSGSAEQQPKLALPVACEALQIPADGGKLARITDSLDLYLAFVAPGQFGHEYVANLSAHSWVIRHQQCKRSASSETKKCEQCASLASDRSIVHNVSRLRSKVFAAQLLRSRLFGDEVETQALLQGRFLIDAYQLEGNGSFKKDIFVSLDAFGSLSVKFGEKF